MDEIEHEELNEWLSTYGLITAERILGKMQINLSQSELLVALKNSLSFYNRLLQIPIKNVLNGIILQQAADYHIYAQKLFIDYLLAGETAKEEASQGASVRESMEDERKLLVELGDEYHQLELKQNDLIASSQSLLIKTAREFNTEMDSAINQISIILKKNNTEVKKSQIRKSLNHALIYFDSMAQHSEFLEKMMEILSVTIKKEFNEELITSIARIFEIVISLGDALVFFVDKTNEMASQSRAYRNQFYDAIIRINNLLKLLPEYRIDPEQDAINREPLEFDRKIGEDV